MLRHLQRASRGALLAWCLVQAGGVAAEITDARYLEPTDRYAHGVLGDAIEYGALEITSTLDEAESVSGRLKPVVKRQRVMVTLPRDHVFEDIAPRVIELGKGLHGVMVVETDQRLGGSLAIYGALGQKLAETAHIGQSNRWLAPIGAADLDGDGHVEIAYIDRPHLAKTLRVWRYEDGRLTEIAAERGFSNHRIGWDYIEGGLRDCGDGPEMILASGDWREVRAVRFEGGVLVSRSLGAYSSKAMTRALGCKKG